MVKAFFALKLPLVSTCSTDVDGLLLEAAQVGFEALGSGFLAGEFVPREFEGI